MKISSLWKLIISFSVVTVAAVVGSLATFSAIPTWYVTLHRTVLTPPNWVFGPVWTLLYILMAVAAFLVWKQAKTEESRQGLILFIEQLVLNVAWSVIFFGLHQILLAFVTIIILWLTIIVTTIWFFRVNKPAGYLMLPYIVWVSFASMLNFAVYLVNK